MEPRDSQFDADANELCVCGFMAALTAAIWRRVRPANRREMKPPAENGVLRAMTPLQSSDQIWNPLPSSEWDESAARHLLRRVGWSAKPDEVVRARAEGVQKTLDRVFPAILPPVPKASSIVNFEREIPELRRKAQRATGLDRRMLQRELRERSQAALQDLRIDWLRYAANPANTAAAKWVLFLSDVYVVSAEKVRHVGFIWRHFDILRQHALAAAPELTKAISRSPAMEKYLDLEQSNQDAPNENFARELFELFVLGEGNYSERDIKEAARAFTGYRVNLLDGEFRFNSRQHDASLKSVFGKTGHFSGDDVVDLAYQQPAAATYLPRELTKFYLTSEPLPRENLAALGERWRDSGFDLRWLIRAFFSSRLFYAPEYRGNFIKSPVQLYLGLLQDLDLSVPPLARYSTNRLRAMGQPLFQPPNVRGWVGGRSWINSSTLAVRRQLVQQLFSPIREAALNADELAALDDARARGEKDFVVGNDWLLAKAEQDAAAGGDAAALVRAFLGDRVKPALGQLIAEYVGKPGDEARRMQRLRMAAVALLQTPDYQVC